MKRYSAFPKAPVSLEAQFVISPLNFSGASLITGFVCSAGGCTQAMYRWPERATKVDIGVRLVELEHPSPRKMDFLFKQGPD